MLKFLFLFGLITLVTESNVFAKFTLEKLLDGSTEVHEIVRANVTVQSLITEFENRPGLSKSDINKYLKNKKVKSALKALELKEKELLRELKRKPRIAKNKCFFGNPEEAIDASAEQIETYTLILAQAESLYSRGEITESTYSEVSTVILTLQNLHVNNKKITEEFSLAPISPTYGEKISIHPEETDIPFELKAGILFDILMKAHAFAEKNHLLPAYFTDGLSKGSGCLEARFRALSKWHQDRNSYLSSLLSLSEEEQAHRLSDTAHAIVMKVLEKNYATYADKVDNRSSRRALAQEVSSQYSGMRDISGNIITPDLVNQLLRETFYITSESPPLSPKALKKSSKSVQFLALDDDSAAPVNEIIHSGAETQNLNAYIEYMLSTDYKDYNDYKEHKETKETQAEEKKRDATEGKEGKPEKKETTPPYIISDDIDLDDIITHV